MISDLYLWVDFYLLWRGLRWWDDDSLASELVLDFYLLRGREDGGFVVGSEFVSSDS